MNTPKGSLRAYFDAAHAAVLWKLEGLTEYDLRRPLTPTGTNLLGLVKHLAWVDLGYFGDVFDRPTGVTQPANAHDVNADMYATAAETSGEIIELFRTAWAHADATIDALDLDAEGHVPWWGANNPVTLQRVIVHMTTEIFRHLGQMDILREQLDGAVGHRAEASNMPDLDSDGWQAYVTLVEEAAAYWR